MKLWFETLLATILLIAPDIALAQSSDRSAARESREARLDARESRSTTRFFSTTAPAPETTHSWSIGLAFDTDEADTRTVTTPFILTHQRGGDKDWWKVQVQGDGYTRTHSESAHTIDGFADVKVDLLKLLGAGFAGGVGLTIPTKGAIGSSAASQRAKLLYEHDFKNSWTVRSRAALTHANGSLIGQSAYTKVLYAELDRTLSPDHDLILNITHTRRGGTASSTDLSGEYDFPFPVGNKLDAAFSLTRGATSGARHTAIEFDLSHKF